jgi:hypothetical protein
MVYDVQSKEVLVSGQYTPEIPSCGSDREESQFFFVNIEMQLIILNAIEEIRG